MEPILCATDFSENAKKAANWAAFLCQKLKKPLYLYNCYHVPVIANDIPFPIGSEIEIEDGLNKLLEAESLRLKEMYKDLEIKSTVAPGFANESILEYAQEVKASLLVIGITGRTTAGQILIGSTAVSASLHAKIPVLIIPPNAKQMKIKNTALACDYSQNSAAADIELFFKIVDSFEPSLNLIHVSTKTEIALEKYNINNRVKGIDKYNYTIHTVEDDSVESGLVHFTEKNNVDLLTIIHKQHGFFERLFKRSHTGKLAYKIAIPLLVLHE